MKQNLRIGTHRIEHPKIAGYYLNCVMSNGMGWEHVSITVQTYIKKRKVERCPTWEEMCLVKNYFWNEDEVVIQYHPAKKDYVSMHPYCLHLWKPIGIELPTPDPLMVGINLD